MNEEKMIEELRSQLKIAEARNWKFEKMLYIDGFIRALNIATGKDYSISCTDIFVTENGKCVLIKCS